MAYNAWSVVFGELPTAAKWNQLGTNDAGFRDGTNLQINNEQAINWRNAANDGNLKGIKHNSSDQLEFSDNDLRPSRFVPVSPPILLVDAVDPVDADFHDVDVTVNTSARCFAISCIGRLKSATTAQRVLAIRENGEETYVVTDKEIWVIQNIDNTGFTFSSFITKVDSNQVFEYAVNNADVSSLDIILRGFWERFD